MAASHGASSLSQSAVSAEHEAIDWASIDDEFCSIISPLNESLNQNLVDTSEASAMFTRLLHCHLGQLGILGDKGRSSSERFAGPHRDKGIIKLTRRLTKLKNIARRSFHAQPVAFLNGVRVHNKFLKAARKTTHLRSARQQEKAFRSNPWLPNQFAVPLVLVLSHLFRPVSASLTLKSCSQGKAAPIPVYRDGSITFPPQQTLSLSLIFRR